MISARTVNSSVFFQAVQKVGARNMRACVESPAQLVTPSLLFWKLITISRQIGYQEKKPKQSTAPIRNPCADTLRLARAATLSPARDRAGDRAAGLRSAARAATVCPGLVGVARGR